MTRATLRLFRRPLEAVTGYLIALPVTVLLSSLVPFASLVCPSPATVVLALSALAAVVGVLLAWCAPAHQRLDRARLSPALLLLLLAAFSGNGTAALLGAAAWSAALALTVPFRRALPLALAVTQVAVGILSTLPGATPVTLFAVAATTLLTGFAPRRTRSAVQDALRPVAWTRLGLTPTARVLPLLG
ncbi:hypothetical protein [Deinococcus radiotolerans]|uniref:Integral membrane protein n=1 Tax=Deinococcus radiotolerans TaxID=1309407 RepID=A0ABQ2FP12_9DEIO|nr:hypothetical protein [Deinococcus radiotolerans]GGL12966.1 hypothetical protein GCM10010844_34660 [Deinococcus radiotolerans]